MTKYMNELTQHAIDYLTENKEYLTVYGCDLHNSIFNSGYYIVGGYQAEQWLQKGPGIFNAIDEIKEYEQSNFGEVNTDLSEAEHVVNMFVYIKGEEVLSNSRALQKAWDKRLNPDIIQDIINDLEGSFIPELY
jgi:hypothetical protein